MMSTNAAASRLRTEPRRHLPDHAVGMGLATASTAFTSIPWPRCKQEPSAIRRMRVRGLVEATTTHLSPGRSIRVPCPRESLGHSHSVCAPIRALRLFCESVCLVHQRREPVRLAAACPCPCFSQNPKHTNKLCVPISGSSCRCMCFCGPPMTTACPCACERTAHRAPPHATCIPTARESINRTSSDTPPLLLAFIVGRDGESMRMHSTFVERLACSRWHAVQTLYKCCTCVQVVK